MIKAKVSLSKYLGTSIDAFDKMFLAEFFEYIDYAQRKIEEAKSSKMNQIIST